MAVAVAIAAGFAGVLTGHESLPTAVVIGALALLGAWYNSLQHEVIHGHPTPWTGVNAALATAPLGLVVPFAVYREIHLAHHPDLDPESFYVSAATWERCGPIRRAGLRAMRTLAGRLVLGPPAAAARWWGRIVADRSPPAVARLFTHVAAVALVLLAVRASGLPIWVYLVGVVWCGGALSLLRSFVEHRRTESGTPSAVVRAGWFFSLLFLNNNLHHTHHVRPGVPWYALPDVHSRLDGVRAAAEGAGLYRGYKEVGRRYLFRPFDDLVVPPTASTTVITSAAD
jgi:fatty acid desaturase